MPTMKIINWKPDASFTQLNLGYHPCWGHNMGRNCVFKEKNDNFATIEAAFLELMSSNFLKKPAFYLSINCFKLNRTTQLGDFFDTTFQDSRGRARTIRRVFDSFAFGNLLVFNTILKAVKSFLFNSIPYTVHKFRIAVEPTFFPQGKDASSIWSWMVNCSLLKYSLRKIPFLLTNSKINTFKTSQRL